MPAIREIQIGKKGITENFISSLESQFKNSNNVKISILKSFSRDKDEIKKISDKLLERLGKNYTVRIIGYTIALKKWRQNKRIE